MKGSELSWFHLFLYCGLSAAAALAQPTQQFHSIFEFHCWLSLLLLYSLKRRRNKHSWIKEIEWKRLVEVDGMEWLLGWKPITNNPQPAQLSEGAAEVNHSIHQPTQLIHKSTNQQVNWFDLFIWLVDWIPFGEEKKSTLPFSLIILWIEWWKGELTFLPLITFFLQQQSFNQINQSFQRWLNLMNGVVVLFSSLSLFLLFFNEWSQASNHSFKERR